MQGAGRPLAISATRKGHYTLDEIWLALIIFGLRVINNAMTTVRFIFIARGRLFLSAVLAGLESLIFAFTVATVVSDLRNPLILTAYAGGFAVGSYVGMWIEARFVRAFYTVNIITALSGHQIAHALRDEGFGVTQTFGEGRDGPVSMLRATIDRRDSARVIDITRHHNPDAFIAMEEARAIRRGYFRGPGNPR